MRGGLFQAAPREGTNPGLVVELAASCRQGVVSPFPFRGETGGKLLVGALESGWIRGEAGEWGGASGALAVMRSPDWGRACPGCSGDGGRAQRRLLVAAVVL